MHVQNASEVEHAAGCDTVFVDLDCESVVTRWDVLVDDVNVASLLAEDVI